MLFQLEEMIMQNLPRSKFFKFGFSWGIFSFILFNCFLYVSENGLHECHAFHIVGFPFRIYQWEQFVWMEKILWTGIIGNLVFGILVSVLFGLILHWFMNKRSRLK